MLYVVDYRSAFILGDYPREFFDEYGITVLPGLCFHCLYQHRSEVILGIVLWGAMSE